MVKKSTHILGLDYLSSKASSTAYLLEDWGLALLLPVSQSFHL